MEDFVYPTKSVSLRKGDAIFLYTDGVTEAMDEKGELFSEIGSSNTSRHCGVGP